MFYAKRIPLLCEEGNISIAAFRDLIASMHSDGARPLAGRCYSH